MKNFRKIELPWLPEIFPSLSEELQLNESLWDIDRSRQFALKVLQHTQTIILRRALRVGGSVYNEYEPDDAIETVATEFARIFPLTMRFINRFAQETEGQMGRAIFARLMPQSFVYPHTDMGEYHKIHDRYHLAFDSPHICFLRSGDEEVSMKNGELWWFDNKLTHEAENRSEYWRSHLIFDIMPKEIVQKRASFGIS